MDYSLLSQDEMDERIVATMRAQQMDHFLHTKNLEQYVAIMKDGGGGDEWQQRIKRLHDETLLRMAEVESIIKAIEPQMPDSAAVAAAQQRLASK